MTPPRSRNPFHLLAGGRGYKMALLSAAAVATAATAATTGVLLNDSPAASPAHATTNSLVMDAAIPAAAAASPATPAAASSPATPTPSDTHAPAADAPKAPAKKVLDINFEYQPNFYYCAPAAVHNALSAHGINRSQDELAGPLGTTVNGTDSAEDTTRVLNSAVGSNRYETRTISGQSATPAEMDRLQADAVHAISNGYAVVANIAGGATDTAGVWHDFPGGHYISLVGYSDDGRTVEVADSSGMYGPSTYWMSTINMANWMATRGYSA